MGLMERRNRNSMQREALIQLKMERAQAATESLMKSDYYKLNLINAPDAQMAVDAIVRNAVESITNPVGDFLDTLRAKGFRQAEIRRLVHRLYNAYCVKLNEPEGKELLYEDMLTPVAEYFCEHQELYSSLDPDSLRND